MHLCAIMCLCRLYEQLEEVKQQKTIRSRQEAYAKNRLKAKEFHMVNKGNNVLTMKCLLENCKDQIMLNVFLHLFTENSPETSCQTDSAVTDFECVLVLFVKLSYFVKFY